MHFKNAVILCVVFFFTSVWSTGLNRNQIEKCIELYNNHQTQRNISEITNVMKDFFGIENPDDIFEYNPNEHDYINFKNLFLALAYKDNKTSDSFEVPMLTPFEVEFFLKEFIAHAEYYEGNKEGNLTREQLSVVFDDLCINEDNTSKADNLIKNFKDSSKINAAEFLLIMLEYLPEGNGLNKIQIGQLINLYSDCITDSGSIDTLKIQTIFKEFNMATEKHVPYMKFKTGRPAAKELMELLLVTAERSRNNNKNVVLRTEEIRTWISEFTKYDLDNDGLLSGNEAKKYVVEFVLQSQQDSTTYMFDDTKINVAESLLFST